MERERWEGRAFYQREGTNQEGSLTIERIQSYRNLVTIQGIGQGKVNFSSDGSFQGCWAMGDKIFDVDGRANGDRSAWTGTFEIRDCNGRRVIAGSFEANKVHD